MAGRKKTFAPLDSGSGKTGWKSIVKPSLSPALGRSPSYERNWLLRVRLASGVLGFASSRAASWAESWPGLSSIGALGAEGAARAVGASPNPRLKTARNPTSLVEFLEALGLRLALRQACFSSTCNPASRASKIDDRPYSRNDRKLISLHPVPGHGCQIDTYRRYRKGGLLFPTLRLLLYPWVSAVGELRSPGSTFQRLLRCG
jgi:hypothetical protein